ncbi:hypothetical protein [Ligilactobacillus pobuzihii]|uniref:hypothetical protein n=1 Tax=Ligilactobacillus pobuzihii TaxID=449659 RepID=UPI000362D926|nr:hypothetical protein [Ligilactobacillus pobuzihii]GEN48937.1 hypothetical protein LPO01_17290 [Ligilactobacillus pobuzihii]
MNQYPHQKEMNAVLEDLKQYSIKYMCTSFKSLSDYLSCIGNSAIDFYTTSEEYSMLNDLEEAAVIKQYCLWYQQEYAKEFPNGRERI